MDKIALDIGGNYPKTFVRKDTVEMNQTEQGRANPKKSFTGLKNLSFICSVGGYLSFLGGLLVAIDEASNTWGDPTVPFITWISIGFVVGIFYLIIAELIKLFLLINENLEELRVSTRYIAYRLKETNQKQE